MGDSDDDVDYKRRDKFRTERRGYDVSSDRGISPRHERGSDWRDSRGGGSNWGRDRRGPYGDSGGYRRDRYGSPPRRSHDMSPPHKRMREAEWDDRYDSYNRGSDFYHRAPPRSYSSGALLAPGSASRGQERDNDLVQPPMLTFKAFLATQDDGISDEEAMKKYSEYKLEFKRQQLNEFFVTHKDEEWFKLKYHPEDSGKRRTEQKQMLKRRVEIFMDFYKKGMFDKVSIDGDQTEQIVKLLDSFVIMLEGGTELDLQVLEKTDEKDETNNKGSNDGNHTTEQNDESIEDKEKETEEGKGRKRKRSTEADDISGSEGEEEKQESKPEEEKNEADQGETKQNGESKNDEDGAEASDPSKPRSLHRTTSIFLRNLAPTITKQEVEALCKKYPGFLRASISDPAPERRWFRRGWVTFERDAKIKEICYNFNNIRLRDCELGPIINRDLTRRIRTVTGLTVDKKVVRNDIRLAAKVITNLDKRWDLWTSEDESDESRKDGETMGFVSSNPLLSNITDYLIEEASAEEEELLGKSRDLEEGEEGEDGNVIVRDEELLKVLDRLLFYLRMVHSVDYYNHCEYPNEDEMPNRCGLMHARASIQADMKAAPFEIDEYCSSFEKKMGSFLQPRSVLTDEEASKLGMKNEEDEVEKFVQANTQELGKDKWLCPLSGKKFKGPEFVRKHIFNKHAEKVDEVKKEVKYYNNYLKDPRRPQLPENPANKSAAGAPMGRSTSHRDLGSRDYHYSGYQREATSYPVYDDPRSDRSGYDRGGYRGRPRYDNYQPRGGRIHDRVGIKPGPRYGESMPSRPIITYRDLDAPREIDEF